MRILLLLVALPVCVGCGRSHFTEDAAVVDATPSAPDAVTAPPIADAAVAGPFPDAAAPDAVVPVETRRPNALAPGEIDCFGDEVCAVGEICCRGLGCMADAGDDGIAECLLCDDDADCEARGTPGRCYEGPFAIGGGVRWACSEVRAGLRVCEGDDCLRLRDEVPRPVGQVECNSGYLGYRTCAVDQVCCDDVCRTFTGDTPDDRVCHECTDSPDCGAGLRCCSSTVAGRYVGNRCLAATDPC